MRFIHEVIGELCTINEKDKLVVIYLK
jgi:hypothetical protein